MQHCSGNLPSTEPSSPQASECIRALTAKVRDPCIYIGRGCQFFFTASLFYVAWHEIQGIVKIA